MSMLRVIGLAFLATWVDASTIHSADASRPIDDGAPASNRWQVPAEVTADWLHQDAVRSPEDYSRIVPVVIKELDTETTSWKARCSTLEGAPSDDRRWGKLYRDACLARRGMRLRALLSRAPRILFTKHYDLGGSHYAYTEGLSDAQAERHFVPGSSLCLLSMNGLFGRVQTLLDDRGGVIRDPDVSYDGKRALFAWKKSLDDDDYHLYEMDLATRKVRQITFGLGFADYEGIYTPDDNIIFNSTRCVQTVDCWWTEVSNLYTCDLNGKYLRRLSFDQVHTNLPTMLPDGRVVYTRWDYNDRGQIYPQGLFQMNSDGTGQSEFYGNNSWFPTTILHARGIPGTEKVMAILTGHHTIQKGWLAVIDPRRGRQENQGVQLIAPVRDTPAERIDRYGQTGAQFQYPYPWDENQFIVAFKPEGAQTPFALYWMDTQGRRELLAFDSSISCNQPILVRARPREPLRAPRVDYTQTTGTYYLKDIYAAGGLEGVPRGVVKRLRIVALDFRAAGIGDNRSRGEAGGALSSTPVSIGNGAWDPKTVLGEASVYPDGSAMFSVPAKTPVYFQALDANGRMVQTMRSWSTLQPGEVISCVGCHDSKSAAPPTGEVPIALRTGCERIPRGQEPPRGFSFAKEVQPILDRHCVRCHNLPHGPDSRTPRQPSAAEDQGNHAFGLRSVEVLDTKAKRRWTESYLALTQSTPILESDGASRYQGQPNAKVNWVSVQSAPPMQAAYSAGSARSEWLDLIEKGHEGVSLTREELAKIACWIDLAVPFCGDYREANSWSETDVAKYNRFLDKRRAMQEVEQANIGEFMQKQKQTTTANRASKM